MTDIAHELYKETKAAALLLAQMDDIVGGDAEARRDLVEGETNLREAILMAVQMIGEDEAAITAIKTYCEALASRADRLHTRCRNIRTAIAIAMEAAGEKKIETPFGTISLKNIAPSVIVTEDADIPSQFWKPQPNKLDKAELLRALKTGEDVPGATLSNGGKTIAIRI